MELDDLKHIWNYELMEFKLKNPQEIAQMLRGNSKHVVSQLKKSVWFELTFTVIGSVALIIYSFSLETVSIRSITIFVLVIFLAYSLYYLKKISLLNQYNPGEGNLRQSLDTLINGLRTYLKFYRRSYTVLYPVYFLLGVLIGGIERGVDQFLPHLLKPGTLPLLIVVGTAFYIINNLIVKWYLNKLYGKHLEKLESIREDLLKREHM